MTQVQADPATGGGGDPGTKPCRACWHPMPKPANKCTKCGSVQDWQRYLNFSGTVLGLLVALISVLTFAIPIWTRVIVPKAPRPSAVLVEVDNGGRSTFAVSNAGTAPAAVEHILVSRGDGVAKFDLTGLGPGERVIQPNDVKLLNLRLHITNTEIDIRELVKMFRSQEKCQIFLSVVTPSGSRESTRVVTTTAGQAPDEPGCDFKLRSLIVATAARLSNDPAYLETICKVGETHPANPANPQPPPRCRALAAAREAG
ncbi:MAG TPA: hypothetical protein VF718_03200 [Allosphingosinicella sp.]|jgi:hypothetical protein